MSACDCKRIGLRRYPEEKSVGVTFQPSILVPRQDFSSVALVATENNREYLPADYGVDAFSKVTTQFDTSFPKVKVTTFRVNNNCINDDGIWDGERMIDTTYMTEFLYIFRNVTKLKKLDARGWNTSNATNFHNMFENCSIQIFLNDWDTSNVTDIGGLFNACRNLMLIDTTSWNANNMTVFGYAFNGTGSLNSIIGGRTIDDVLQNNISCFNGLRVNCNMLNGSSVDRASIRAVINGLADLTGQTPQTLTIGATLLAKLTEEDVAVATNKNWTIV